MKLLYILLITLFAQAGLGNKTPHAKTSFNYFEHEGKSYLAFGMNNDEHWHTYWKNPGDAGLPTSIKFLQNDQDLSITQLEWPTPKKYIEEGNILAYGYGGKHTFFFELKEKDISSLAKQTKLFAKWLICKDICIPESKEINFTLNNKKLNYSSNFNFNQTDKELIEQLNELPQQAATFPSNLEIYLNKDPSSKTNLALNYSYKNVDASYLKSKNNLLTPFPVIPFGFKHEKLYYDQANKTVYGKILVEWDGDLQEPEIPFPVNGIFASPFEFKFLFREKPDSDPVIISHQFSNFSIAGQQQLDEFYSNLSNNKVSKNIDTNSFNVLIILIYAFIGGLILNLMPCVLPVISLKLFGLIAHRDESKQSILRHNIFYSFGVISTFIILASIVAAIKASGESIGWGFQLQSPIFVLIMALVIFILSLNMFGLYEFKTPFGNKLGNTELKKGVTGDFFSGVLTTILSTPCSAPFLGSALTYAFTTSVFNIYLIFIFIGIGLSFPFIATGIFPAMINFLPKPGIWMEKLKNFLGLTLLLTVVWLNDVLMNIVDAQNVGIYVNSLYVLTFFAFYFHNKMSHRSFLRIAVGILPLLLFVSMIQKNLIKESSTPNVIATSNLNWQAWSEDNLGKTGGPVFIDFTAKWCLTCKVNKKIVFETDDFENYIKENKIQLMIADWTKYDPEITKWLEKYNVVSVPAYFVKTKSGEIKFLGETISLDKIKNALK